MQNGLQCLIKAPPSLRLFTILRRFLLVQIVVDNKQCLIAKLVKHAMIRPSLFISIGSIYRRALKARVKALLSRNEDLKPVVNITIQFYCACHAVCIDGCAFSTLHANNYEHALTTFFVVKLSLSAS